MRTLLITAAAALALAFPAAAGTLQEVVDKGIVLSVEGMDIDVTYTKDGKFTAMDGQVTGTYKIDGDKFCTTSNFDPTETCTVYPKDKKSGDSFDLAGPQGTVKIKIK
jgi:phosphate-selective porin